MEKHAKPAPATHHGPSSFLSLLTGWAQQGVESYLATQRIFVDVAMRQNTAAIKALREGMSADPEHSPLAILTELAIEGTTSFIEAQRVLLNLAQQENEIIMNGVKEHMAGSAPTMAMTDLFRRSLDTFIRMQEDFLKTTSKQTLHWLHAVQAGKGYTDTHLLELAREGMDTFVQAQKKFLDVIAQEAAKATAEKHEHKAPMKKTELSKLAREATNSFIEAQKRLLDVMGQQMNVNMKAATRTMGLVSPARIIPIANFTSQGVKNFVDAEKNLIESIVKPHGGAKVVRMSKRHPAHHRKTEKAQVAGA